MTEPNSAVDEVSKFDDKLHKLIKRAKKQRGLLWPDVVSKLKLARADVRSMIKVYNSGPKGQIVPVEIGLKAKVK
jgi:hypothetical protein